MQINTNGRAYVKGNIDIGDGEYFEQDKVVTEKPVISVLELSLTELIETLRFLQSKPEATVHHADNGTYVIPDDKIEEPPAHINTGGGKYVKGSINTGKKDFVGRS